MRLVFFLLKTKPKILSSCGYAETLFQIIAKLVFFFQKHPPEVFCKNRCSQKFRKIQRKTPVPESLFLPETWHRCFPVSFAKFLRTPFSQNTSTASVFLKNQYNREMETVIMGILHMRPSALSLIHLSQVDEPYIFKKISLKKTMALYKELILLWLSNVLTGIQYNMQYTSFVIIYCLKDVKLI